KSEFRTMVRHQISDATIYNRLRGVGKSGKPTRQKLEGVQAEDGSWWVNIESKDAAALIKQEKDFLSLPTTQAAIDARSDRKLKGLTPAELRASLKAADDDLVEKKRELAELEKAKGAEIEALKEEINAVKQELAETQEKLEKKTTEYQLARNQVAVSNDEIRDLKAELKSNKTVTDRLWTIIERRVANQEVSSRV
ncbi:hypothetical protein PG1550B_1654, partial [Bifidobacterium pseudolongum subsp. globosum]|uniref:hypothetical protein n=1 Tax=Bifidobacterium pseudolongum TaxID=1694 RepID=UPI0010E92D07